MNIIHFTDTTYGTITTDSDLNSWGSTFLVLFLHTQLSNTIWTVPSLWYGCSDAHAFEVELCEMSMISVSLELCVDWTHPFKLATIIITPYHLPIALLLTHAINRIIRISLRDVHLTLCICVRIRIVRLGGDGLMAICACGRAWWGVVGRCRGSSGEGGPGRWGWGWHA